MNGLKFVFCEGADDVAVVKGVADSIGLAELQIEGIGGKNNLRNFLREAKTRPEFSRNEVAAIGVIRDADNDPVAAFRSVCDALVGNGFKAPGHNGGFAADAIRTGVLIVGPNAGKGMVEDLCLKSVSDRPEFACVDDYFRCIADKSGRKDFTAKARVRAWMASQTDFDVRVGKAAERGYWPWSSPVFDPVKEFLRQL
jgi:hypothetical protein